MWLSDAKYVAAVVNAGGMAFITPRSYDNLSAFRAALRLCFELTEGKPFGVNITQSRRPEANQLVPHWIDLALHEGVRAFETVGPSPERLFEPIHAAGGIALHKAAFVDHAVRAQERGADAVALVGMEAGGHPGTNELPSFVLGALALPRLTVPLVLGGGIGSGRQIAAALALGAEGVLMGTRFLVCDEIWAHAAYKQHLAQVPAEASTLALRSTGNPWRVLDNATVRKTRELEAQGVNRYPDFGVLATGRLGRDHAYAKGDWETGLLSMGPAIGFASAIESVDTVIRQLMTEAAHCVERLGKVAVQ